ncbi:MAG TPA: VOC family protein [Tepidiformaceae bacterium]|nr:VOC family protein [Tepidiformaceae bacterium]
MLTRIDHLVVPVPDLEQAAAAYERLGLVLTPRTVHEGMGTANRAAFIGSDAANFSYIELLGVMDREFVAGGARARYLAAADAGGGLSTLAFGVDDMAGTVALFEAAGMGVEVTEVRATDGRKVADAGVVSTDGLVPFGIALLEYPETWGARFERSRAAGRFGHTFGLKRLDHLAAFSAALEADTALWVSLGATVVGEIPAPGMVIRQLKIGDAIFELLAADGPESRLAGRPAGLASMAAWEVDGGLDGAIGAARERGFTVSDAEVGVIPGTRRATVAAGELGGLGMQLIEYV